MSIRRTLSRLATDATDDLTNTEELVWVGLDNEYKNTWLTQGEKKTWLSKRFTKKNSVSI